VTYTSYANYLSYTIQAFEGLSSGVPVAIILTTQAGVAAEGINFPTVIGTYKA
jgi:hypothetical protein